MLGETDAPSARIDVASVIRGSRARAERVPGTGIGLAMCRAMARLLGGSVGVESPSELARERGWPGPGATFFVRVPLARAGAASSVPAHPPRRVKPFSIA
jgi:light-regulated signal transduction histidine kinase (bacteriophytochrome)